jgi:hypothetical protein
MGFFCLGREKKGGRACRLFAKTDQRDIIVPLKPLKPISPKIRLWPKPPEIKDWIARGSSKLSPEKQGESHEYTSDVL